MVAIASLEFNLYITTVYDDNQKLNKNVSKMQELINLEKAKSKVAPVQVKLSD